MVTADEALLDDLLRLVAASGAQADVSGEIGHVRARWRLAPVVLLGADLLPAAARAGLPRRDDTLVLSHVEPEPYTWSLAVEVGASKVLTLPDAEAVVADAIADAAEDGVPGLLVGVIGGRGGAGASTLTCALGVTAARSGRAVLVVDADPLGGGFDLLLGVDQDDGRRWPDLRGASGRLAWPTLRQALPSAHGVSVLSHQRGSAAEPGVDTMLAVTRSARRAGGLVLVDLPRWLGAAPAAVVGSADRVLLVVPADLRSCAAAGRVADAVCALTPLVQLVVRVWRGCPLSVESVVQTLQLPLAAVLRADAAAARSVDDGVPAGVRGRGALAACSRTVLHELPGPARRRVA